MWINHRRVSHTRRHEWRPICDGPLAMLRQTVDDAVFFFMTVDEAEAGYPTAHEHLSQLLFWHREYLGIARALAHGERPTLRGGTLAQLNRLGVQASEHQPLSVLAQQLAEVQDQLEEALRALPDWQIPFPVKQGGRPRTVERRVRAIEAQLRHHLERLARARQQAVPAVPIPAHR